MEGFRQNFNEISLFWDNRVQTNFCHNQNFVRMQVDSDRILLLTGYSQKTVYWQVQIYILMQLVLMEFGWDTVRGYHRD